MSHDGELSLKQIFFYCRVQSTLLNCTWKIFTLDCNWRIGHFTQYLLIFGRLGVWGPFSKDLSQKDLRPKDLWYKKTFNQKDLWARGPFPKDLLNQRTFSQKDLFLSFQCRKLQVFLVGVVKFKENHINDCHLKNSFQKIAWQSMYCILRWPLS